MNPKEELEKLFPGNGLARAEELRAKSAGLHTREVIDSHELVEYPINQANELHNDILRQYRYREKEKVVSYLNYKCAASVSSKLNFKQKMNALERKNSEDPIIPVLNTLGFTFPTEELTKDKGFKHAKNPESEDFYYATSPYLPNLFFLIVLTPYGDYDLLSQHLVYSPNEYQFRKYHHLKPKLKEKVLGQFVKQPEEASPKS